MQYSREYSLAFALASLLLLSPSGASADASTQVGNATVSLGAGTALLTLPDVRFLLIEDNNFNTLSKVKTSGIDDEYGYSLGGWIEIPASGWFGALGVRGFYANIETDDAQTCVSTAAFRCGWNNPAPVNGAVGKIGAVGGTITSTEREVDHWGVAIEGKRYHGGGGMKDAPGPGRYFALGADFRAIQQDFSIDGVLINEVSGMTYREDLDARYYGAYLAWGGDYNPFVFRNLWQRWGLQSSFRLQGGVYVVDADYDGAYAMTLAGAGSEASALSLSEQDVAFIGGVTLETRKRIGERSTLALTSTYEYYSWVPDMAYRDDTVGAPGCGAQCTGLVSQTRIGDDDAFSARTMLRLTVSLGGHAEPATK